MPLMIVWPVSSLSWARKVGSCRFHFQSVGQLLALGGAFRFDGHGDDRVRKLNRFQEDRVLGIAQCVAGDGVTQTDDAHDVARGDRGHLLAPIGLDVPKLRHVFLLVLAGIEHARIGLQFARVHAGVKQVAVFVGVDLEHQAENGSSGRLMDFGVFASWD
jgi:hypothetical protein